MENQKVTAFLMFTGQAEEAMKFYISVFTDSQIVNVLHHENGTVLHANFMVKGQQLMCIDSMVKHDFTFTPSISLFVTCDTSEEIDEVYEKLSQNGQILMPIAPSPVSEKFAWVQDRYGVSWQLNLARA